MRKNSHISEMIMPVGLPPYTIQAEIINSRYFWRFLSVPTLMPGNLQSQRAIVFSTETAIRSAAII
jgi:hypothetical protein